MGRVCAQKLSPAASERFQAAETLIHLNGAGGSGCSREAPGRTWSRERIVRFAAVVAVSDYWKGCRFGSVVRTWEARHTPFPS